MRITGKTKVAGIFGFPVSHTLSPVIQNAAFEEKGLDFVYLPFPVEPSGLKNATEGIRALNLVGVNVTIPHKESIVDYMDELSPEVKVMGAVNTVVNREGRLVGYNTDWQGFIKSLQEEGVSLRGKNALLLGAGGAALSVCFALINEGIGRIVLTNRTFSRAKNLARKLEKISNKTNFEVIEFEKRNYFSQKDNIDFLVNATSLGMNEADPLPVNLEQFPPSLYVYDVIYNRETELLKQAKKLGMRCQGGFKMLIYQGALAFELWTGEKAPVEKMKAVAKKQLGI